MKILFTILVFTILFVLYVKYLEKTSVFYPQKNILHTPDEIGLKYEQVTFLTEDKVKLSAWFIPFKGAKATLLFFHGNAGNIGDRLSRIQFYHELGLNIFIVDYRGYGDCEGEPSEQGMYLDALGAYDYSKTRTDIDGNNIVGYGASLGGAAIIDLATKRSLKSVIVDSTFTSAADMSKRIFPFVPTFLLSVKLDSLRKIPSLEIPKLFIHSLDDQTVPYSLGRQLFEAANNPKEFVTVTGPHDDIRSDKDIEVLIEEITVFLRNQGL